MIRSIRPIAVGALLFIAVGCRTSESADAPQQAIATSSTTAEDAQAIDGPVMRYRDATSTSGKVPNLLQGVLQLDGNCLYLVPAGIQTRFPILWPAGTRWDVATKSVVSPGGDVMPIGAAVEGRGGYFYLSDVNLLAGPAAWNLSVGCVENGQIVVAENRPDAIGPKGS